MLTGAGGHSSPFKGGARPKLIRCKPLAIGPSTCYSLLTRFTLYDI